MQPLKFVDNYLSCNHEYRSWSIWKLAQSIHRVHAGWWFWTITETFSQFVVFWRRYIAHKPDQLKTFPAISQVVKVSVVLYAQSILLKYVTALVTHTTFDRNTLAINEPFKCKLYHWIRSAKLSFNRWFTPLFQFNSIFTFINIY